MDTQGNGPQKQFPDTKKVILVGNFVPAPVSSLGNNATHVWHHCKPTVSTFQCIIMPLDLSMSLKLSFNVCLFFNMRRAKKI